MRRVATEWQARNECDASLFGFDSTVVLAESLWRDEQRRRDEWSSGIDRDHQGEFIKFLQGVKGCLHARDVSTMKVQAGKRAMSMTASSLQSRTRKITVPVRSVKI